MFEWLSQRALIYVGVTGLFGVLLSIMALFHFGGGTELHVSFGPSPDFKVLGIVVDTWSRYLGLFTYMLTVQLIMIFVKIEAWPVIKFNLYDPNNKVIVDITKWELIIGGAFMKNIELLIEFFMFMLACQKFDILITGIVLGGLASILIYEHLTRDKIFCTKDDLHKHQKPIE